MLYDATTSSASGPQMRATSARNSLSGRTLTGTSRITEKSRAFSSRRRTPVRALFALEQLIQLIGLGSHAVGPDADPNGDDAGQVHARQL